MKVTGRAALGQQEIKSSPWSSSSTPTWRVRRDLDGRPARAFNWLAYAFILAAAAFGSAWPAR